MEPRQYRNFTLRVRGTGQPNHYEAQIFGVIPGSQPAADDRQGFVLDPDALVGYEVDSPDAPSLSGLTVPQLRALGTYLADLLLAGSIRQHWWQSLSVTRSRKQGLRLRLMLDRPELARVPWELLYLRPPSEVADSELFFLALQPDISIVRHEALDPLDPPAASGASYRMVVALAAPRDQSGLALDAERSGIEEALAGLPQPRGIEPEWVEKATRRSLREALRTQTDVLHLAGHSRVSDGESEILLLNADGSSNPYPVTALASLLEAAPPRLVIFNTCETGKRTPGIQNAELGRAVLRAGVAAAVAGQFSISATSATPLSKELYIGMLTGLPIDQALSEARRAMYQETNLLQLDWAAPVLYLRAEEGILFPRLSAPQQQPSGAPNISIQVTQTFTGAVSGQVTGVSAGSIGSQVAAVLNQPQPGAGGKPRLLPPRADSPLVGREEELSGAQVRLEEGGKVYFYGTYGVGKTSIAAELYRRLLKQRTFADGCLWERVSSLTPEKVLDRVAGRFAGQQVAQATSRDEKVLALTDLLAGRTELLIALDEVEDRSVAQAILQAAGECTVILNGTKRLNLAGAATEQRLKPLSPQAARDLFTALARPSGPPFNEDEGELISDICAWMRNLPLAVKLAALKLAEGTESLESLHDRLEAERASLVSEEDSVVVIFKAHYETLKSMPTALDLLTRIASFPALEASVKALQEDQADFYSSKDKLVDLGLIDYIGTDRLALHPLLCNQVDRVEPAAFARGRERAIAWLNAYAEANAKDYNALDVERANFLALFDLLVDAKRWNDLVGLLHPLFNYLRVRGQWQATFEWLDALVKAEGLGEDKRAWGHMHRGILHGLRSEHDRAMEDLAGAGRMYGEANDLVNRGKALYHLAGQLISQGELNAAREQLQQALAWMADAADPADQAGAHASLGYILVTQGEVSQARPHFEAALKLGDTEKQARAHITLGRLARQKGDARAAQEHLDAARQLVDSINDMLTRGELLRELGFAHYYEGRYDEARQSFEQGKAIYEDLKYEQGLGQMEQALGNVALAEKRLEDAANSYRAGLALNERKGQRRNAAYNRYQLGVVAQRQKRYDEANQQFEAVRQAAESMGDIGLQAAVQHQLGSIALAMNDLHAALTCNQRALTLAQGSSDALTKASALFNTGRLQLLSGHVLAARQTLTQVQAAFIALRSPEAVKVESLLAQLAGQSPAGGSPALAETSDIDIISKSISDTVQEGLSNTISAPVNLAALLDASLQWLENQLQSEDHTVTTPLRYSIAGVELIDVDLTPEGLESLSGVEDIDVTPSTLSGEESAFFDVDPEDDRSASDTL